MLFRLFRVCEKGRTGRCWTLTLRTKTGQVLEKSGGCDRDRTCDPLIKSQLLYQLSYAPTLSAGSFRPDEALYRHCALHCPAVAGKIRQSGRKSRPSAIFTAWPEMTTSCSTPRSMEKLSPI